MQVDKQYFNISGRLVQGNVFEPQTTDMQGRPLTDINGNPKVQYFIGVAVQKNTDDFNQAWANVYGVGARDWPTGEYGRADFSWKIIDGDDPKHAGKEGFAGNMIFRFTSGFPFQAVAKNAERPITNPAEIKRGYFVRIFFTVAGNKSLQKPGVYLNCSVVEVLAYGEEITSGPDASALVTGAGMAPTIPGMQANPVAAPAPAAPAPGVIQPNPAILNPAAPAPGYPVPAAPAPGYPVQ